MMRKVIALASAMLIAVFAVVLILNWTPKTYRVTGTITRDGKPLEWKGEKSVLCVRFVTVNRNPDSTVYVYEGDPKEGPYILPKIPSGKYRVSIQQMDPYPTHDLLQFKFALKDSPIIREVSGDGEINIDLPKDLP